LERDVASAPLRTHTYCEKFTIIAHPTVGALHATPLQCHYRNKIAFAAYPTGAIHRARNPRVQQINIWCTRYRHGCRVPSGDITAVVQSHRGTLCPGRVYNKFPFDGHLRFRQNFVK